MIYKMQQASFKVAHFYLDDVGELKGHQSITLRINSCHLRQLGALAAAVTHHPSLWYTLQIQYHG